MIDKSALRRAIAVGTLLQVAFAFLAHISDWIAAHALLFGAMMISAAAGYLYARDVSRGYPAGAMGGLVAGGVSGFFGFCLSIILGDSDPGVFVPDLLILLLTATIGGLFGQMAAGARHAAR